MATKAEEVKTAESPEAEPSKTLPVISQSHAILTPEAAAHIFKAREAFIKAHMDQGRDWAIIPGTKKPTLLKPGAEKLNFFFQHQPDFEIMEKREDWDQPTPFFFYQYRCVIRKIATGEKIAEGIGSCNSKETKYRYRWYFDNQLPKDVDKGTLTSKKFKSKGQWHTQYRMENIDTADQVNTVDKMAQKRAYVAATLLATQTSDRFTQDMEDLRGTQAVDAEFEDVTPKKNEEKITVALKKEITERLETPDLKDEEKERIKKKLDFKHPGKITKGDLFTKVEAERTLRYIAFRENIAETKEKLLGHFSGDEEAAIDFAKETLSLSKVDLDALTEEHLEKLKAAIETEQKE